MKIARRQREHKRLGEESEEQGNSWREGVGVDLNKTHMCMCDILKTAQRKKTLALPCRVSSAVWRAASLLPASPYGVPFMSLASSELSFKNLKSVTLCCAFWPVLLFVIYSFEVGLGLRLKLRVTHMATRGSNTELHSQSIIHS